MIREEETARARERENEEENNDGQLRWGERRSEERSISRLSLCRSISILSLDESA